MARTRLPISLFFSKHSSMVETGAGGAAASGEESAAAGMDVSREGVTVQQFEDTVVELTTGSTENCGGDNGIVILTAHSIKLTHPPCDFT